MSNEYLKFRGGITSDLTKNPNEEALYSSSPFITVALNGTATDFPHSLTIWITPWEYLGSMAWDAVIDQ